MFVISLCLGKLAVALLFIRLSSAQRQIRAALLMAGLCLLYGLTSFLLVAIQDPGRMAHGILHRWIAIAAMGDLIDVSMVIFPFFLVRRLQMRRSSKITVITGFAMRLP